MTNSVESTDSKNKNLTIDEKIKLYKRNKQRLERISNPLYTLVKREIKPPKRKRRHRRTIIHKPKLRHLKSKAAVRIPTTFIPRKRKHEKSLLKKNIKSYAYLHMRLRKRIPIPDTCALCRRPPHDLANMTGIYNEDDKNYLYLCRGCHVVFDTDKYR